MTQDAPADTRRPPRPAGTAARWVFGGGMLVCGFLWFLLTLTGPQFGRDVAVSLVLVAGGLVVLMPHRVALPRKATFVAVVSCAVAGVLGSLVVKTTSIGGDICYLVERGWPFTWVDRGACADQLGQAVKVTSGANWDIAIEHLIADLVLWGCLGLVVTAVVVLARRRRA